MVFAGQPVMTQQCDGDGGELPEWAGALRPPVQDVANTMAADS